jgi:hypothetical protein
MGSPRNLGQQLGYGKAHNYSGRNGGPPIDADPSQAICGLARVAACSHRNLLNTNTFANVDRCTQQWTRDLIRLIDMCWAH